ncbi:MAG: GxxExxY protein [Flavisolibacter sp.]
MTENEISNIIIQEAIYVHSTIGPGMLESVYLHCLAHRLKKNLKILKLRFQFL